MREPGNKMERKHEERCICEMIQTGKSIIIIIVVAGTPKKEQEQGQIQGDGGSSGRVERVATPSMTISKFQQCSQNALFNNPDFQTPKETQAD